MTLLLPHQLEAKRKMHNGCILKGATGVGKTMTALAYYNDVEVTERLIIITTAQKRDSGDWQAEARYLALFPEVDSWHNMAKYADVKDAFFIFDEQRVVGSGPWVKAFLKICRNNQWIMLTATPGDSWLDYIPVFIANGFYKNRSEFLQEHVIFNSYVRYPKVQMYLRQQTLRRRLASILVEMSFEKHTVRHEIPVFCEWDRDLYDTVWIRRWNYLEDRPIRNIAELFSLLRRSVNSHPSRLENVRKLMTDHPRMIVFYNFDYELEILRTLAEEETWNSETMGLGMDQGRTGGSSGLITATAGERGSTSTIPRTRESFAVAEYNGHKHQPVPGTDSWVYLVQYRAGSEAWNCTLTDTMVFYSLNYSYRASVQSRGRIDRLDTPFTDLWYYTLQSATKIDEKINATNLKKKNFNERTFLKECAGA